MFIIELFDWEIFFYIRFSRLFILDPLNNTTPRDLEMATMFAQSYLENEPSLSSDSWYALGVEKLLTRKNHPFSDYSLGSYEYKGQIARFQSVC